MEEEKIFTTDLELQALIGLAASHYLEEHRELDDDFVLQTAAEIASRVISHLTGKTKFSENLLKEAKQCCESANAARRIMKDTLEDLLGETGIPGEAW